MGCVCHTEGRRVIASLELLLSLAAIAVACIYCQLAYFTRMRTGSSSYRQQAKQNTYTIAHMSKTGHSLYVVMAVRSELLSSFLSIVHENRDYLNGGSPFCCEGDFPVCDPLPRRCLLSSLEWPGMQEKKRGLAQQNDWNNPSVSDVCGVPEWLPGSP